MLRKILIKCGIVVGILLFLIIVCILSKNFLLKHILQWKLSNMNKGKVTIESVDLRPLDHKLTLQNVIISSKDDKKTNIASIEEINMDYELYFFQKKIILTDSSLINMKLMTPKDIKTAEPKAVGNKVNKTVTEPLTDDPAGINSFLENEYRRIKNEIISNRETIKARLEIIEDNPEFLQTKTYLSKIINTNDPLAIFSGNNDDMIKFLDSSKKLLDSISAEGENYKKLLREINQKNDLRMLLDNHFNSLLGKSEKEIDNFDLIINEYVNKVYEPKIYNLVLLYRNIIENLKKIQNAEKKEDLSWEVIADRVIVTLNAYGMDLSGELSGISSHISQNTNNIIVRLTAWESVNNAIIESKLNLEKMVGTVYLNIPNANIRNIEELKKYADNGTFTLNGNITLNESDVFIVGMGNMQELQLHRGILNNLTGADGQFLEELMLPLLRNIRINDINYSYSSLTRKIMVKTDLSQKIIEELNKNNKAFAKEVISKMKERALFELDKYQSQLTKDEVESLKTISDLMTSKKFKIEKVYNIVDKLEKQDKNKIIESIINKI